MLSAEANFNVGLVVREQIILQKYWRQTEEQKLRLLQNLATTFNEIFGTDVTVASASDPVTIEDDQTIDRSNVITLGKLSLMTFLHSFAYNLLLNGFQITDDEEQYDALARWSHTIFCLASREEYFKSKEKGLFFCHNVKFLGPLENCTTREEVDVVYNQCILAIRNAGTVELTAEPDVIN